MKIHFKVGGTPRPTEPFSTRLVLVALTLWLVNCFVALRTTGPPGLEKTLPTVVLWFSLAPVVSCILVLAMQLIRERSHKQSQIHQPGKLSVKVTAGDILIIFLIAGGVFFIIIQALGILGAIH